jgi:NTP pyrophosphatase (non-canonical NTP hydrolase)
MTEQEFLGHRVDDVPIRQMTISDLIRESHAMAVEKGWWEKDRPFSEGIALMHSELSEALEQWREFGIDADHIMYPNLDGKPEGIAVELADVLIRIGDWCGKHGIPLEAALRAKMAYNKTRPHRHGGKLA